MNFRNLIRTLSIALIFCTGTHQSLAAEYQVTSTKERIEPSFIDEGQSYHGGTPSIDKFHAELPRNLRVTFTLNNIAHEVVSGDGVADGTWISWFATSPDATVERITYTIHHPLPDAGNSFPMDTLNIVYDGIVTDGCGNTPTFEIDFESWVRENFTTDSTVLGAFSEVDEDTIQPNGFWNFSYSIRISEGSGNVSDIRVSGVVNATCTNLEDFSKLNMDFPRADLRTYNPEFENTIRDYALVESKESEFGFISNEDSDTEHLHCDGNTGYSCDLYVAACSSFGGVPSCIPVQTPGGGTNGSLCDCGIDW